MAPDIGNENFVNSHHYCTLLLNICILSSFVFEFLEMIHHKTNLPSPLHKIMITPLPCNAAHTHTLHS